MTVARLPTPSPLAAAFCCSSSPQFFSLNSLHSPLKAAAGVEQQFSVGDMDIAPDTVEMRLTRVAHRLVPGLMSSDKQTPPAAAMPPPPATGISLGLTRIHRLLAALRSPHHATPVVHIAGTNGKGSVSAYLASILQKGGGIATARFNSPHLVDEWDCIHLHDRPVDEHTFRAAKQKVQLASERENVDATSFEVLTATAFTLFATATPPVDLAVVEVGMGGAQDATNVVPASRTLLSVITALDLDHQKFLGDTVGDIARVKAGIIREEGDVVVSVQAHEAAREAIEQVAHERHARVWQAGRASLVSESTPTSTSTSTGLPLAPLVSIPLEPASSSTEAFESPSPSQSLHARLPLPGSYQLENAATAVLCASLLRSLPRTRQLVPALGGSSPTLTDAAIRTGVEATRWPGRLSWLSLPRSVTSSTPSATAATRSDPDSDSNRHRLLLLDGAHNPSSALLLASYLSTLPPHLLPSTLIFALSAPRDPSDVVRPLLQALLGGGGGGGVGTAATTTTDTERKPRRRRRRTVRVVCCGFSTPVGMDWVRPTSPAELADQVRQEVDRLGLLPRKERGGVEVQVLEARDAEEALRIVEAAEEEEQEEEEVQDSVKEDNGGGVATTTRRRPPPPPPPIVVAGSLYLVADVMRLARRLGADAGAMADGREDA